jgi:hypothetical protein
MLWTIVAILVVLWLLGWVRPSREETPDGASRIEDGCYW